MTEADPVDQGQLTAEVAFSAEERCPAVRCPKGHVMEGRVTLELLPLCCRCCSPSCAECGSRISARSASFFCKECRRSLCMECATSAQAAPARQPPLDEVHGFDRIGQLWSPSDVLPGDIFMCGPDRWGIHHIILCRGPMQTIPRGVQKKMVDYSPCLGEYELFECNTIESSRPLKGSDYPWYPATTYFGRPKSDESSGGELVIIGDMADKSNTIGINKQFVPVKLLLHPLRPGFGGPPIDVEKFQTAVRLCAGDSKKWSKRTAVSAIIARRCNLNPQDYCDMAARSLLMEDLRRRWSKRPICSSVAIQIWQRYFDLVSGSGPTGTDLAAQQILRWMPVLSDKTAPSALLNVLSISGWVLRDP